MTARKSPEAAAAGWRRLALWLAGASTLAYVCSRFVPCAPPSYHDAIEDTYIQFLHTAFAQHLQFGRDVVYPFGPWGLLYGGYNPATHWVCVTAWLGLSLVFWWVGWQVARGLLKNELAAWIWFIVFTAVAGLPVFTLVDARLTAFVVLLWLSQFFVEGPRFVRARVALVVALGLLSLGKSNILVEMVLVLTVVSLDEVIRHRRLWMFPCFGASLLLFWVAADQNLRFFGSFIHGLRQNMSGYTEATMLTGPNPMLNVGCFLLASAIVCGVGGYAIWLRDRFFGVFPLGALGLIVFTAFKHGYVRHDTHDAAATLDLLLASLAVLAVAWPLARARSRQAAPPGLRSETHLDIPTGDFPLSPPAERGERAGERGTTAMAEEGKSGVRGLPPLPTSKDGKDAFHRVPFIRVEVRDAVERVLTRFWGARRRTMSGPPLPSPLLQRRRGRPSRRLVAVSTCVLLPTVVVFIFATVTFSRWFDKGLPAQLMGTFSLSKLLAPAKPLLDPGYLRAGYQAYLADIRNQSASFPPIQGEVDHYPGDGIALLARNFDYRPRPVMHSCAAYTPELAELNAAFLRSARARANILFQIIPIDGRFPSLEDGLSWPELLTRYDVREVEWPFVLLKRDASPRTWRLEPLEDSFIRWGELTSVPPMINGPIWATFDINKSLLGTIASTLYKPPILRLSVFTHDGKQLGYRLIPGMASGGFLLSPVIPNCWAFAELARSGGLRELADKQVDSVCITADTSSGSSACYRSPIRLRFYRLDYPGQDLGRLEGFPELNSVARMAGRAVPLHGDFPPSWDYLPACGSVLRVSPNSAIQWSVEGQPKRLKLGFGILRLVSTLQGARGPEHAKAWTPNGVVFRVSAVGGQGALVPLWSQRINPPSGGLMQIGRAHV